MGQYRNEDEALIGLARQLTDAYGEARTQDDQDYACDEIAAFLAEQRLAAPGEALIAIFDLPLTAETYPLVDEAQSTLARRGPAIVETLLAAVLGEVYDPDGPAPERAAETLDLMDRRDAAQGLTEVLCGHGDDQLKGAAADALVALGAFAEPALAAILNDPAGAEWAQAALEQIRFEHEHPGIGDDGDDDEDPGVDDYGFSNEGYAEDAGEDALAEGAEDDAEMEEAGAGAGDEAASTEMTGAAAEAAVASADAVPALPDASTGPDQDLVDDAYERFLRSFEQQAGGDAAQDQGAGPGGSPETPSSS